MQSDATTPDGRKVRQKRRREATRSRLLDAAIKLALAEGLEALRTTRISSAAGIKQPNFYAHFANVDACMLAVGERVREALVQQDTAYRRGRVLDPEERLVDSPLASVEGLLLVCDDVLQRWLAQRDLAELFLRYRRSHGSFGEALRDVERQARADLGSDLRRAADELGLDARADAELQIMAEQLLGATFATFELLVDGRVRDRALAARMLAEHTHGALVQGLAALVIRLHDG